MRILWVLLLASWATISTVGMSESCKVSYNACLNSCPEAPRQGAVGPGGLDGRHAPIDPGIAACTAACNGRARSCR